MKSSFFANAVVLTLTSQFMRLIGIFFIAYLSNKIGAEGVGLYQLIFTIYSLAATLASSGIGTAVSRLTAESMGKSGHTSTSNVMRRAIVFSLFFGLLASGTLFFSANFIGSSMLGDSRTILSLKMLSPGLPFLAVTSSLRGFFYGTRKIMMPATQMIFEQTVQLLVLFSIINFFIAKGLEYVCLAVAISFTIAEVLSCGFGIVLYIIEKNRSNIAIVKEITINRQILGISLPVSASSYLRSGLRTAENILLPTGLRKHGMSESEALSKFGLIGMVTPILLFPSSFLSAIATLLIPEISEANAINNIRKIKRIFSRVFQLTSILSLLFCGIFIVFANDLGISIYQNKDTGVLLMMLAPLVPLIYLDFIVDAMLNGLNQQVRTFKINVLDYTIRICLIYILIPRLGFWAYIPIFYSSTILNAFLSIRRLLIACGSKIDFNNWIFKPILSVITAGSIVILVSKLVHPAVPIWIFLIIKLVLMIVLYASFLFVTQCLNRDDICWFKQIIPGVGSRRLQKRNNAANLSEIKEIVVEKSQIYKI